MKFSFYNTLKHRIEQFKPLNKAEVKLYTCGPTVYNHAHIGNLRAYLSADILKRALQFNDYDVNWVMNITDIDDKTIANTIKEHGNSANVENLKEFTNRFYQIFLEDLKKINIEPKDISFVKVTEKIADIQEYIVKLMEKGYAYKTEDGSTYFSIAKYQKDFGDYGDLVGEKFIEGKKIGARVKVDEYDKENLSDFALWKAHGDDDAEIFWDHPVLGKGRPGWHIECTLINYYKFPSGTDIHTGGIDLLFPHHTNEIAQGQALYRPYVNYWMHSDHIQVKGTKMAKSAGNFLLLSNLEQRYINPLAFRYLILQSHYKSKLNITDESLAAAQSGYNNIIKEISKLKNESNPSITATPNAILVDKFRQAINNDLNTSEATAIIFKILDSEISVEEKLQTLYKIDEVLGLSLENSYAPDIIKISDLPEKIQILIQKRDAARKNKDYSASDQLRSELEELGYLVEDSPKGTKVQRKP
ncbi:MAG: Cysteine--tRNA ligase [Candidatus Doudnabacteria bacterium]|nr:Cysteine--tRNA ligase [Candidatus Doudnabacteria bacterium]